MLRQDLDNKSDEIMWLEVRRSKCKPILLACCYRPPDQPLNKFIDGLEQTLQAKVDSLHFEKVR